METIHNKLGEFKQVTLAEMDSVKLLNRVDTKYLFHVDKLSDILNGVRGDYNVLNINNTVISDYETLYYDTNNLSLYMSHHNGLVNRYKIRFRRYVNSNLNFFEIKFKNNKERTIKNRIKWVDSATSISGKAKNFLEKKTHLKADLLNPMFFVNYSRITLVNKAMGERLTLDLNLAYNNHVRDKKYQKLVIAELKQDVISRNSPFAKLMKEYNINSHSISKYCLGVTQLYPEIKCNNFKPKLLTLNKIIYANT